MPPKRKPKSTPEGEATPAGCLSKKFKTGEDEEKKETKYHKLPYVTGPGDELYGIIMKGPPTPKEICRTMGDMGPMIQETKELPVMVIASPGEGVHVFSIPAREITQEVSEALELARGECRGYCMGPTESALEKVWEWCSDPERTPFEGSEEADLKEKQRREEVGYGKFWRHKLDEKKKAGPFADLVIIKSDA